MARRNRSKNKRNKNRNRRGKNRNRGGRGKKSSRNRNRKSNRRGKGKRKSRSKGKKKKKKKNWKISDVLPPGYVPKTLSRPKSRRRSRRRVYALQTPIGSEDTVSEGLLEYFEDGNENSNGAAAVMCPYNLHGYIFVEATDRDALKKAMDAVMETNKFSNGALKVHEALHYLDPDFEPPRRRGLSEGDIVDIVDGRYEGQRGFVRRIYSKKKLLLVELIDEMVKMPVRIPPKFVKRKLPRRRLWR